MRGLFGLFAVALIGCTSTEDKSDAVEDAGSEATTNDPGTTHTADSGVPANVPTWYQDVAPVFAHSCDGCHLPGGVGSPTWSSPEEAAEWAVVIGAAVESRQMPPWRASGDCTDYADDFSLTDAEIDTIVQWADGGAPLGDAASPADLPAPYVPASLARVDTTLQMAEAYTPTADGGPDDYRCFLMEWPYDTDVWVTGYELLPGNEQVVHHIIPYLIDAGDVATYQAMDDADDGPGYRCYGGPGGDIDTLVSTRWLGSWAPGVPATVLPEGTGIHVAPGGLVAFQVHYNIPSEGPSPDQSGIALTVETERQGWADLQPLTDVAWVFGSGMEIPAETDGVTHSWSMDMTSDFKMHSGSIHMHTLGKSARLWVEHADGTEDCLLQVDDYDFNWQRGYRLNAPVQVVPGDSIHLSCTWDNPTDQDVKWGDGTADEMCLGVSLLTE